MPKCPTTLSALQFLPPDSDITVCIKKGEITHLSSDIWISGANNAGKQSPNAHTLWCYKDAIYVNTDSSNSGIFYIPYLPGEVVKWVKQHAQPQRLISLRHETLVKACKKVSFTGPKWSFEKNSCRRLLSRTVFFFFSIALPFIHWALRVNHTRILGRECLKLHWFKENYN